MEACRWLTLGSGNWTSQPEPRPITTRGASKVMLAGAARSPERTTTVSAIRAPHHGRPGCRGKAEAVFSWKLGPNRPPAVVGRSTGTDPTGTVRAAGLPGR